MLPSYASFHTALRVTAFALLAALAACTRHTGDATQVAAKVNDSEISIPQVEYALQRRAAEAAVANANAGAARRVLDSLVEHELAAQEARKLGLERDPRMVQAFEAVKRDVLAQAYRDTLAEKASLPSSDEIDRYYDSEPMLFSQRRVYTLRDLTLEASEEQLSTLRPRIEAADDAARAVDLIREAGRHYSSRQVAILAEDVPMALLRRISQMRDGQSLVVQQAGGARVLTVLGSQSAPLAREAARAPIRSFLVNDARRRAVLDGMKHLRDSARVEYKGSFAQAASQPDGAPAPAGR
jgi:EpsD family peptidyl-prolyl cis-trans isomerase